MAERVGFEPTKGANPCRFSRPVHSTALPPLRCTAHIGQEWVLSTGAAGAICFALSLQGFQQNCFPAGIGVRYCRTICTQVISDLRNA